MTPWALIRPARLAGSALLRTQSDERLVDLVRAGNDRAFEAIVHRYRRPLFRHCRRLLPPGPAEDAVQQAFLHALEAIRADQRELALSAWLHRIAQNAAIDSVRRMDSHWEELDERMDGVEPTHAAAERRARFRSVVAGLGALPERQRRALVLRELEGRTYDEIAEDLGGSPAAVRQLLNRARNAMRSGASAVVPATLVSRVASSPAGVRMAEMADPPGSAALLAKATAAVAASALALLAVSGPGDRGRAPLADARANPPAQESRPPGGHSPVTVLPDRPENRAGGAEPARQGRSRPPAAGREETGEAGDNPTPGRLSNARGPAAAPKLDDDDAGTGSGTGTGDDGTDDDAPEGLGASAGDEPSADDEGGESDDGDDHAAAAPVPVTAPSKGDDTDDDEPSLSSAPTAGTPQDTGDDEGDDE